MEELTTTKQVVEKLGGVPTVADLTGRKYSAAWNWTTFDKFPADTFVVLQKALRQKDCTAPASLWGMVACETERAVS